MPPIPTTNELILLIVMVAVVALPEVARIFFRKPLEPKHAPKED